MNSAEKPTYRDLENRYMGMCTIINRLVPWRRYKAFNGVMRAAARAAVIDGDPAPWLKLERAFGPFVLVSTRARGPKKKAKLTERIRAERARRGRGSIEAIADELKLSPRTIRYHLYETKI